jgi:transcriptional regulator with XRE-family HTH domain
MMQGGSGNFWGNLIHDLRDERHLSQRKLAEEAQVNRSTLRRIEEGTARGDIDVIERLLSNMGYELEALDFGALMEQRRLADLAATDPEWLSANALSVLSKLTHRDLCN